MHTQLAESSLLCIIPAALLLYCLIFRPVKKISSAVYTRSPEFNELRLKGSKYTFI